jgi:hypothetical protein
MAWKPLRLSSYPSSPSGGMGPDLVNRGLPAASTSPVDEAIDEEELSERRKRWTEKAFNKVRPLCNNTTEAIDRVASAIELRRESGSRIPRGVPPADRELLNLWAADGGWEDRYQRNTILELLEGDNDDEDELRDLQTQLERATDVLDAAYDQTQSARDPDTDKPILTKSDTEKYKMALAAWSDIKDRLNAARERIRRRRIELQAPRDAIERKEKIVAELTRQYGDLGPQYRLLVEMAASIKLRIEMMEVSGRDYTSSEFEALAKLFLNYVGQMQKYTEATKSESITKEVNEFGVVFMGFVDQIFGDQPTRVKELVKRMKMAIETGGTGLLAPPSRPPVVIEHDSAA